MDKTVELVSAYGTEIDVLDILAGKYDKVREAIVEARKEELQGIIDDSNAILNEYDYSYDATLKESGIDNKYTVIVTRPLSDNAELTDLVPSVGTLEPLFDYTKTDYVLIVNDEKNGIPNYIGANSFAELAFGFYFGKKVFKFHRK